MKTSVRNRMAELLLKSFNDSEKRDAIEWLSVFCRMASHRARPEVPLEDLLEMKGMSSSPIDGSVAGGLQQLIGEGKLLQLRRADITQVISNDIPRIAEGVPWVIEPQADSGAAMPAMCERTRVYVRLVGRMRKLIATSTPRDPLRRAMAEAALCFNAGLFFEAHEHLEHHWAAQPKGATRRFLQGIIQISVGFHHACIGKYDGAINQLGKGLDKTVSTAGEFLGLDCDTFLPRVASVREALVRRGRANMCPLRLSQIPRMPIKN